MHRVEKRAKEGLIWISPSSLAEAGTATDDSNEKAMRKNLKRYRIVAEAGGVKTKCPLCEILLVGKGADEVDQLLHHHLSKHHAKQDETQAAALIDRRLC
jgi:hypothetical protein